LRCPTIIFARIVSVSKTRKTMVVEGMLVMGCKVHADRDRQGRRLQEAESTLEAAQALVAQAADNPRVPRCLVDNVH